MISVYKGVGLLLALGLPAVAGMLAAKTDDSSEMAKTGGRLVRNGVAIDFEARPLGEGGVLREGALADIRFRVTDASSGQPLTGLSPGAWLDLQQSASGRDGKQMACKTKVGLYLRGVLGIRPLLDLNSYYLLILNRDPSITVIDPLTSVGGVTSTLTRIPLARQPMDWVASADDKRLFVSMPEAGAVAVIDAENFKLIGNVAAGSEPLRVALQPDGRYLWVGNDTRGDAEGGVTVIDTQTLQPVLSAATGKGHHEIAFSTDSRHAFVSNRESGTLSVFDMTTLEKVRDIRTGPRPLAVALSPLSQAVYVSDGEAGTISVIDARSLELRKVIRAERGIGPLRFTRDGRYGFVLNSLENTASVIDAASDEILHRLEVAAEPYQVDFTRAFAYVRGLASPRVTMVDLNSLGKERQPSVLGFEAGTEPPKLAGDLPLASGLAPASEDAALFVVNPVDNTTYFYMEGMNVPMSGYLNRGHIARAATVIDRSLREEAPGVFSSRVKLPAAGRFDVAFMLDQPSVMHCFSADVQTNPELERQRATPRVEFLLDSPTVSVGSPLMARFRLVQGRGDTPRTGVGDLRLRYFMAPASRPKEVAAREVGEGVYEAPVEVTRAGAYYLHVGSASLGLEFGALPYVSLRAVPAGETVAGQQP